MSCNWDNARKYLTFTYCGTVTVRTALFKQDQTQFRAERGLVMCSVRNHASGELITDGEDRMARVFDADGPS
jgi:hypothetical protein